jgi:hypothetical protein
MWFLAHQNPSGLLCCATGDILIAETAIASFPSIARSGKCCKLSPAPVSAWIAARSCSFGTGRKASLPMQDFVIFHGIQRRKSLIFGQSINGAPGALLIRMVRCVHQVVAHLRSAVWSGTRPSLCSSIACHHHSSTLHFGPRSA